MDNPNAKETKKIPVGSMSQDWASDRQSELMSMHTAAVGGATGYSKSRPTIITSGSTGYDGTTDPGAPGEPV